MTRTTTAALVALATLAPAPSARAGDGCKPVYGFYTSQIQPTCAGALCTAGELIGGIQADYAFVATGLLPANALAAAPDPALVAAIFYVGASDVALKHGGEHVFASDAGVIDQATGKQAALLVITGGTGAYEGATGFLQLRGTLAGGQVTGDYSGEICTP